MRHKIPKYHNYKQGEVDFKRNIVRRRFNDSYTTQKRAAMWPRSLESIRRNGVQKTREAGSGEESQGTELRVRGALYKCLICTATAQFRIE